MERADIVSHALPDNMLLPTNGQDWANYITRYGSSSHCIQAVLSFNSRLDSGLLAQAVRLSVDAEPVLGCFFDEQSEPPVWRRLSHLDNAPWFGVVHTDDAAKIVQEKLAIPLPMGQQLQVTLVRAHASDALCIKCDHACSDAGGLKEYLRLLSAIYTRLIANKTFVPEVNTRDRGMAELFTVLGITNPKMAFDLEQARAKPTWCFPYDPGEPNDLSFAFCRIKQEQFSALRTYAHRAGFTINDLLLTAYFRSLYAMTLPEPGEPMSIHVTVDLRRYLPQQKAAAICNLSGVANAQLARVAGESAHDTLVRVAAYMRMVKGRNPGLHSAASMELMSHMRFQDAVTVLENVWQSCVAARKASPILSNVGIVAEEPLMFGDCTVDEAYIVTPAMTPPGFMLGASTYRDALTLSIGFCRPMTRQQDVNMFLEKMAAELLSFI